MSPQTRQLAGTTIFSLVCLSVWLAATLKYGSQPSGPLDLVSILDQPEQQKVSSLATLKQFYSKSIDSEVQFNNWNMGCSDLNILAPYVRIIMDRYNNNKRQLIFDVGANNGQDASMVMGVFQQVIGMCVGHGHAFKVFSIEPSPKVFCELEELAKKRDWARSEIVRLNIGLSDKSGILEFLDPGHEGGQLQGSVLVDLPEMLVEDFDRITSCYFNSKNHSNDEQRTTNVTTYTMDQLVKSLESSLIHEIQPDDNILILKIDTEGHDLYVMKGSNHFGFSVGWHEFMVLP